MQKLVVVKQPQSMLWVGKCWIHIAYAQCELTLLSTIIVPEPEAVFLLEEVLTLTNIQQSQFLFLVCSALRRTYFQEGCFLSSPTCMTHRCPGPHGYAYFVCLLPFFDIHTSYLIPKPVFFLKPQYLSLKDFFHLKPITMTSVMLKPILS